MQDTTHGKIRSALLKRRAILKANGSFPQMHACPEQKISQLEETMSDHGHLPTAQEAAQDMISEGAPLGQPHGRSPSAFDEAVECLQTHLNETVREHPLRSLLIAFGAGLWLGGFFSRD
jgi:hypothetical protein